MPIERFRQGAERRKRKHLIDSALAQKDEQSGSSSVASEPQQASGKEAPFFSGKRKGVILTTALGAAAVFLGNKVYRDKETGEFQKEALAKSVKKAATIGPVEGLIGVAGITIRDHRELTHRSVELAPWLQKVLDFEQRSLGVREPYTWASVHRIHHEMTDASLYPFYLAYHAVKSAEANGAPVAPEHKFKNFDPFVEHFDLKTVMDIGESADAVVKKRMGDLYEPPTFDNPEQIKDVIEAEKPLYWYPDYSKKKGRDEYEPNDIARILLTDPHSPALVRRENGVQGVAMTNISLYQTAAAMFRHFPEIKPEDLQRAEDFDPTYQERHKNDAKKTFYAGFVGQAAAMYVVNRDYTWRGAGRAVLEGAAINGLRAATELVGGNVTNSAGHMGDPVQTELAQAFLNRIYDIKLKPDGSISTNTVGKGVVGRVASWATLDEVGGQEVHHRAPWKVRYTDAEGRQAVVEAPWGSFLEYLAKNEHVSAINEGAGFAGEENDRPDVVHRAVRKIQDARAEQYQRDYPDGEPEEEPPLSGGISRLGRTLFSRFRR